MVQADVRVGEISTFHLLRYLRALPTICVHPELDGRTLDIVHSLNKYSHALEYIQVLESSRRLKPSLHVASVPCMYILKYSVIFKCRISCFWCLGIFLKLCRILTST